MEKNILRLIPSGEKIDEILGQPSQSCPYCGESTEPEALEIDSYGHDAYEVARNKEKTFSELWDAINRKDLGKIVRISRNLDGGAR